MLPDECGQSLATRNQDCSNKTMNHSDLEVLNWFELVNKVCMYVRVLYFFMLCILHSRVGNNFKVEKLNHLLWFASNSFYFYKQRTQSDLLY